MIVVAVVLICVSLSMIFFVVGKAMRPEAAPDKNFKCPYCQIEVFGYKELDLINHVSCINKSSLDIAAEAKKAAEYEQDEYYVEYKNYSDIAFHNGWKYSYGYYYCTKGRVFRNGTEIATVTGETATDAKSLAEQAIELDKHKRKAKKYGRS